MTTTSKASKREGVLGNANIPPKTSKPSKTSKTSAKREGASGWGGARPGAGRRAVDGEPRRHTLAAKVTDAERERAEVGGAAQGPWGVWVAWGSIRPAPARGGAPSARWRPTRPRPRRPARHDAEPSELGRCTPPAQHPAHLPPDHAHPLHTPCTPRRARRSWAWGSEPLDADNGRRAGVLRKAEVQAPMLAGSALSASKARKAPTCKKRRAWVAGAPPSRG